MRNMSRLMMLNALEKVNALNILFIYYKTYLSHKQYNISEASPDSNKSFFATIY